MNFLKNIAAIMGIALAFNMQAKMVEFTEDAYAQQAPKKLVDLVEKTAQALDFTQDYEVIAPKKPGIEINPWNKFIGYGINSLTKNPFIVINTEWFTQLPEDQQLFLIGRDLLLLKNGITPSSFTIIQYSFFALSILLLLLLIWIFSKTLLNNQKMWIRIIVACFIVGMSEYCILDPIEARIKRHFGVLHDQKIHELVLEKLSSREAAVKALRYFDDSLKNELKKGETLFAPHEKLFETYAQNLQKS